MLQINEKDHGDLASALYQIHGLAALLETASEKFDSPILDNTSHPLLSLGGAIREKANFCLRIVDGE